MSIIIDTNCFSRVFCRTNQEHAEFKPVLDWIIHGHGFLVYGGSKYKEELKKAKSFLKFFRLLKDFKKAVPFPDKQIDEYQKKYEKMVDNKDFDDPHLPAIVLVSKCRLICTKDFRSKPFVTSSWLYPPKFHVPYYYTSSRDSELLCDDNIDKRLKCYSHILKKKDREKLNAYF